MSAVLIVIMACVGCIGNLVDFYICALIQDKNTVTMRGVVQVLDLFILGTYVVCIIFLYCYKGMSNMTVRIILYLILILVTEFSAIVAYGLFMGIWNQSQKDIMDFYKQVAIMVLVYQCLKYCYFLTVILLLLHELPNVFVGMVLAPMTPSLGFQQLPTIDYLPSNL